MKKTFKILLFFLLFILLGAAVPQQAAAKKNFTVSASTKPYKRKYMGSKA